MSPTVQPRLQAISRRRRFNVFEEQPHPAYVVWELSLRCDHACRHCGSRAGIARPDELSTEQVLQVAEQLGEMGASEVVLIGGEAYLHPGFLEVIRALSGAGIFTSMVSGGLGITAELAEQMAEAGLQQVSISVDGLEPAHDRLRMPGSFQATTRALHHVKAAGLRPGANTNFNRLNRADVESLYEHLRDLGVGAWQVQITVPMGRAADRPDLMLQPWDLLDLVPRLAAVKRRGFDEGVLIMPGNNLGYFGPEEALLRSLTAGGQDCFCGCFAGRLVLGIQSDGAVKGCLSLQSDSYIAGNLREQRLAEIWQKAPKLQLARRRDPNFLWGFCGEQCPFSEVCMAGCTFTSHSVFGRPGNNPYCHFRARQFKKRGLRERLVPSTPARGAPMDYGLFEIVVEDLDAPDPGAKQDLQELLLVGRKPLRPSDPRTCR